MKASQRMNRWSIRSGYSFDTYCGAKNIQTKQNNLPLGSRDKELQAQYGITEHRNVHCQTKKFAKRKVVDIFEIKYDKDGLLFVRWQDNNIVTVITNYDSVEPLAKTIQPLLFQNYNKAMGGLDMLDQCVK
ncbi:hypothetical protein NQ315_011637 [Exocentrus adspersus]|uniref:PiggyBac transposable element-derived protein domain-containing protein n=1 Tax=Exocentrus adspersus TaxID=1586481 RepID=A0AAV8V949_9CUCU|nr:hypothetical protein NQ315_011637 [Exocentrus adspersus]